MVSRMSLIVWLLESKKAFWLYEQPHSSLMFQHPRMQQLVKACTIFRTHMYMGAFGAESPKPTFLWGPVRDVAKFSLPLPDREWTQTVNKSVKDDGTVQISGNANLKATQTYPKEFGVATVRIWRKAIKRSLPQVLESAPPCSFWTSKDCWKDADLSEVMQFLSMGTFH